MRRSLPLHLFACPQLLTCARSSLTAHSHTDYYGEPPVGGATGEGEVSSTYGQYDLCGFPKAASFWYRTQWLLTVPDGPDKTFPTGGKHEVRIVESWESPDR